MNKSSPRAPRTQTELREITEEHLTLARENYQRATTNRIRYARLARQYGLTNKRIGECLGITEAAVRGLLQRNTEVA